VLQLVAGAFNVALLAPVWMQLLHLFLACALWLAVFLLGISAFAAPQPQEATAALSARAPA